ncbi:MAG TPA: peptide chain release factor N(5)-glutamine methyltransferase, partial [Planctomycetota bacterium]|nr:peptide chain release factor N(5)-glutamine methyltransferase [Planctomycetota bacterium]
ANVAAVAPDAAVTLALGDLYAPFDAEGPFDLVVSNPPYVADDEWASLPREVRDHEPALALRSGPDPLAFHRRLTEGFPSRAAEKARLALELGRGAEEFSAFVGRAAPQASVAIRRDLSGFPRIATVDLG